MPSVCHNETHILTDVYGFTKAELLAYLPGLSRDLTEKSEVYFDVTTHGEDVLTIRIVNREN